ncbi:MAG: hypothetical protein WA373_10140 [Burkholderiales bacterium]
MTTATLDNRYAGWGLFRTSGATWGVSEDAEKLAAFFGSIARDAWKTSAGYHRYSQPIQELMDVYRDCSSENWDGEGASAVTESVLDDAVTLLFLLPPSIQNPTFQPEPAGAIALEWYKDPKRVLLLSVNGTRSIQYAGLLGDGNETHGKVNFAGSLPRAIQDLLDAYAKV